MTARKVTLTDAEREALENSLYPTSDLAGIAERAESVVESIIAARVAEALRDAAKRLALDPDHQHGWAAEYVLRIADSYDPEGNR